MSVLQSITTALSGVIAVSGGEYPANPPDFCGKIVFTGTDKPSRFMGGGEIGVETFKVVIRGSNYDGLEQKADAVRTTLNNAGFIQTGGYEDIEPKEGEAFLQLAVDFKVIK